MPVACGQSAPTSVELVVMNAPRTLVDPQVFQMKVSRARKALSSELPDEGWAISGPYAHDPFLHRALLQGRRPRTNPRLLTLEKQFGSAIRGGLVSHADSKLSALLTEAISLEHFGLRAQKEDGREPRGGWWGDESALEAEEILMRSTLFQEIWAILWHAERLGLRLGDRWDRLKDYGTRYWKIMGEVWSLLARSKFSRGDFVLSPDYNPRKPFPNYPTPPPASLGPARGSRSSVRA